MKKNAITILAAVAILSLTIAATARAEGSQAFVVKVPFNFMVGSKMLPAGEYHVQFDRLFGETQGSKLVIRSTDFESREFAQAIAIDSQAGHDVDASALIFNKYGDTYFLSKALRSGSDHGCELVKSRAERELRKQGSETNLAKAPVETRKVTGVSGKR